MTTHPNRSIFVAALISLFITAGVALTSLVWVNRSSSMSGQPPAAALQVPQVAQVAQTMQPPGAIPSVVPTFDARTPLPTYPTMPATPESRTPIATRPMPTWTALVPGVDPSFDSPRPAPAIYATPRPTLGPNDPWGGTLFLYGHPNTLYSTRQANLIVTGTIMQVNPARWTTSDGKRPANPHALSNKDTIFRPIRIKIDSFITGSLPQTELLVMASGGTVGQDTLDYGSDDRTTFREGDRVLIFLTSAGSINSFRTSTGLPLWQLVDHYTIQSDGSATNTYTKIPLSELLNDIRVAQSTIGR